MEERIPPDSPPSQPENMYTSAQVQELVNQHQALRLQVLAYAKNCETLSSDNQQLSR